MIPRTSQLNSFTDIFGDDATQENISQPISLPFSFDTIPESPTSVGLTTNYTKTSRPMKHTGQHGEFRSVEEIDPKYRCLFTYPYFNLVQSRIIEDALYSDKSLVLCAPTGSGKTVAFEMAILQLLMQNEDTQYTGDFKIIYMAPVKAVCNERLTEWYPKLTKLGLLCIEVTGDTEVDFTQLKPYKVIITTPEKWDILTRRWRDHRGLVEMIKLFLIDEVHILNDETRGPVLEAVVSRMKTIESAAQSAHRIEQLQKQYQGFEDSVRGSPPRIRFVAVSATVSNPQDVADWLGGSEKPAVFYKFGDECRPVKLKRIVEGYPCSEGTSIFKFDLILNYKLWSIIQKYYNGKPTLIFCNTRKSVALTAEALSREITVTFNPEQKAKLTALASTLKNKKLQMLVMSGVGCHHAGLLFEERVNIERAFRERDLPILITTTTLAMGVNLPAHLVIIKNTQQYVNGAYQEYSISTVLQMVGRAGRPQFDTEATAVIMTRLNDRARYKSLVGGSEPLQSYLHKRIAENLNSEAALGTVTDVAQCVEWLRSTFLYVRAAKDPKRYLGLPPEAPMHLILKKIEELCVKAMNGLASSGLITMDDACCIESTEAGRLMSIFYLDVETMKNIMKIDGTETLERLLCIVCDSHELSDMHLRVDERRSLNLLNRNNAAATIRFPMRGKISTRQMKLNCIIQAVLGCLPIPDPSLNQEAMKVMRIAARVCTCLVKYMSRSDLVNQQTQGFSAVLNSIILAKCIEAHLWENSPYVSKQLKGIGPTFSTLLASAGKTSFILLEESHPRDLERIMNKGPPAGNVLRKQVSLLPKYQVTVTPKDTQSVTVQLMLLNHAHLSENLDHLTAGDNHKSYLIVGDSENHLLLLAPFSDKDLISVYDGTMSYEITRKQSYEHKIMIHCISSRIAGIDAQSEYLFQDLVPPTPRESDYLTFPRQDIPKKSTTKRQTNITDVYKERKRKNYNDVDITQCKEKKKRENALTEKLKALKDSFGKTSKEIKKDIDKSTNMSCKLLSELLNKDSTANNRPSFQNIPSTKLECPTIDLTNEVIAEPWEELTINSDDYDYIDDLQIDSILNKIETEITGKDSSLNLNNGPEINIQTMPRTKEMEKSMINTNIVTKAFNDTTRCRLGKDIRKRKNFQPKSNFNVIDVIAKKASTDYTDKVVSDNNEGGFSDMIKCHINKFLERAQGSNPPSPGINELVHKTDNDLPAVLVKNHSISDNNIKQDVNTNIAEAIVTNHENNINNKIDITALTNKSMPQSHEPVFTCMEVVVNHNHEEHDRLKKGSQKTSNLIQNTSNNNFTDQVYYVDNVSIQLPKTTENENDEARAQNLFTSHLSEYTLVPFSKQCKELENVAVYSNGIENKNDEVDAQHLSLSHPSENELPSLTRPCDESNIITDNNCSTENKTEQANAQNLLVPYQSENILVLSDKAYDEFKNIVINNYSTENKTEKSDAQIILAPHRCEITSVPLTKPYVEFKNAAFNNNKIENKIDRAGAQNLLVPHQSENTLVPLTKSYYESKNIVVNNYSTKNKTAQADAQNLLVPHGSENTLVSLTKPNVGFKTAQVNSYNNAYKIDEEVAQHFIVPYREFEQHNIESHNALDTNSAIPHQSVVIQSNELLRRTPFNIVKNPVVNMNSHYVEHSPSHNSSSFYESKHFSTTDNLVKRQLNSCESKRFTADSNNQTNTHFNRYSYTATKVDVCTKNTSDHQLRITRKLKVDVDITEIVTQENTKTNKKMNSENENFDIVNYTQSHEIKNISNNESNNECLEKKFDNSTRILEENMSETNLAIDKHDDAKIDDEEKLNHRNNEGETIICTTKSNIGNILQKYSKILVKSETNTPIVKKINLNNSNKFPCPTKTETQSNTVKTRRPFKIRDIHNIDVALPCTIIEATKLELTAPLPELLEHINDKNDPEDEVEPRDIKLEQCEEKIPILNPDINEKSPTIESPILSRSLELETAENIEDENMFNPRMLLQYFSTDSNDIPEIIPPPAEFNDNATSYSPTTTIDYETYENRNFNVCSGVEENIHNYSTGFESSSYGSRMTESPKEETWCLSRDDENTQALQPISSAPWIISQRINDGLVSRRTRLGQFKFVRKKPLRPR